MCFEEMNEREEGPGNSHARKHLPGPIQRTGVREPVQEVRGYFFRWIRNARMALSPIGHIDRAKRCIVAAYLDQNIFHPGPILKHQARRLHEVAARPRPTKAGIPCFP